MATIAKHISDLVGNTPLLRLQGLGSDTGAEILLKLEGFNPIDPVKGHSAGQVLRAVSASRQGL